MTKTALSPNLSNDFYIIPKWICVLAKIYGYWPYSISMAAKIPPHTLKPRAKDWLWTLLVALIYIMCTLFHGHKVVNGDIFDSTRVISVTKMSFGCVAIIAVATTIWRHAALANLIEILRLVDNEVIDYTIFAG